MEKAWKERQALTRGMEPLPRHTPGPPQERPCAGGASSGAELAWKGLGPREGRIEGRETGEGSGRSGGA